MNVNKIANEALLASKGMEKCFGLYEYLEANGIIFSVNDDNYRDDPTVILELNSQKFIMTYTEKDNRITMENQNRSTISAKANPDFYVTFLNFINEQLNATRKLQSACIQLLKQIDRINF